MITRLRLTARAQGQLRQVARSGAKARPVRRAQALLWLHRGAPVETVAERLGVSRQTIYNWIGEYQKRHDEPLVERLQDQLHPGRPPTKRQRVKQRLKYWLKRGPQRCGYASPIWTVPRLRCQVQRDLKEAVSVDTVRRALRALRYRYKRPRYVPAERPATWRQAKGGLNTA